MFTISVHKLDTWNINQKCNTIRIMYVFVLYQIRRCTFFYIVLIRKQKRHFTYTCVCERLTHLLNKSDSDETQTKIVFNCIGDTHTVVLLLSFSLFVLSEQATNELHQTTLTWIETQFTYVVVSFHMLFILFSFVVCSVRKCERNKNKTTPSKEQKEKRKFNVSL